MGGGKAQGREKRKINKEIYIKRDISEKVKQREEGGKKIIVSLFAWDELKN